MKRWYLLLGLVLAGANLAIWCILRTRHTDKAGTCYLPVPAANGTSHYVDHEGNVVIENTSFGRVYPFSEGLACVTVGGRYGFINLQGSVVIAPQFDDAFGFHDGAASVWIGGKAGVIDSRGNFIIPAAHDWIGRFYEGLAVFRRGDRFGYIDRSGRVAISPRFLRAGDFSEGLASVEVEAGRWGYVDQSGELVIAATHVGAEPFSDGLAAVGKAYEWEFIDRSGARIIGPLNCYSTRGFRNGRATMWWPDGSSTYIDWRGKAISK